MATEGDTMRVGTRSKGYTMEPGRPGFGTSRHWSRDIGDWRYSFTLVNMPDGEVRWSVSRYDTPISQYPTVEGLPEENRMRFGCYWHPYREWTFKECRHTWVAGMMYVHKEDVIAVAAVRHVECEKCEITFDPAKHDPWD